MKNIAIIGGGAAGYFTALTIAEADPSARITIYERSQKTLSKVKISGGGRCNVTHSCFEPAKLATHYPRGARELRAAFHRWQPKDTIAWFAERGVTIKREGDGRMFPDTDDSQTIIDCFQDCARRAGIQLRKGVGLKDLKPQASGFSLHLTDDTIVSADKVCIAVGSLKASPLTRSIESLGHTIEPLVPSLFAFNLSDKRLSGLSGLSVQKATVTVAGASLAEPASFKKSKPQSGPLLITHRGLSGPAILRTSAWEARQLNELNYHFDISINWLNDVSENQLRDQFAQLRKSAARKSVKNTPLDALPRRLWERLVSISGTSDETIWTQLPKKAENKLIQECVAGRYSVEGKTTNKDEFVTAGGVRLKELDFRTMESKIVPRLHFAGECIDIDGITGGFNFQAAWTTGRIAGLAMCKSA